MKNHESAILVVLAYVIGFTTAFIMFTLATDVKQQGVDPALDPGFDMIDEVSVPSLDLMQTTEGLFVKSNGKERIISAFTADAEADAGFYTAMIIATVSPNGEYVHYCAEMSIASDVCRNFVYSAVEDVTYVVKDQEGPFETPSSDAAQSFWSGAATLNVSGMSADPVNRWTLR